MPKRSVIIRITGKVQGVYYRQSAAEIANELGIKGTVENKKDQSVEAKAFGEAEKVDRFIQWCRFGPAAARVEDVDVKEGGSMDMDDFKVIR